MMKNSYSCVTQEQTLQQVVLTALVALRLDLQYLLLKLVLQHVEEVRGFLVENPQPQSLPR